MTMLCDRCESTNCGTNLRATARIGAVGGHRLLGMWCAQCGTLLSSGDSVDAMLGKLSQLARFGLGAGSGTILREAVRSKK